MDMGEKIKEQEDEIHKERKYYSKNERTSKNAQKIDREETGGER